MNILILWGIKAYGSQNWKLAYKRLKPISDSGYPHAQYLLASMYFNGWGVARNDKEMVRLYRLSAEAGLPMAQFLYGGLHMVGKRGVAKNMVVAERYIRRAAEKGVLEAMYHIARFYKKGTVYAVNYVNSCAWYEAAATLGYSDASGKCKKLIIEKKLTKAQVLTAIEIAKKKVAAIIKNR